MNTITINQALEEILATLQYTPDRQEINEKELDRLYGKKEEMSPEEKITYTKCLLVSAMINDGNKVARRKQVLYILYSLRDEQSPEVQAQIAYYRAVARPEESPKGQPASAERELREAIKLDPDDPVRHFNLGDVLRERGDLEGAIGSLSNVPSSSEFYGDAQKQIAEYKSQLEPKKKGLWDKFTGLFTKK